MSAPYSTIFSSPLTITTTSMVPSLLVTVALGPNVQPLIVPVLARISPSIVPPVMVPRLVTVVPLNVPPVISYR